MKKQTEIRLKDMTFEIEIYVHNRLKGQLQTEDNKNDIIQDAVIKVLSALDKKTIDEGAHFEEHVMRKVKDAVYDWLEKQRKITKLKTAFIEHAERVIDLRAQLDNKFETQDILSKMLPAERQLVTAVAEGYSHSEIATALKKTEGAVKTSIWRIHTRNKKKGKKD
jgi:RNA polymerase sigma factor (sigma-70 family)